MKRGGRVVAAPPGAPLRGQAHALPQKRPRFRFSDEKNQFLGSGSLFFGIFYYYESVKPKK